MLAALLLVVFCLVLRVLRRAREEEDGELLLKALDRLLRAAELLYRLLG